MRFVHVSDIHFPLFGDRTWDKRWADLASRVREHEPQAVIVTGDVIDSTVPSWVAASRLEKFVKDVAPTTLGVSSVIFVPGNHDVKAVQGLGRWKKSAADAFANVTGWHGGWSSAIADRLHVYSVDSNHQSWFARGRIRPEDLDAARIPTDCVESNHLHVFAMHHHVMSEPAREGEHQLTTDDRMLALDDPTHVLTRLASYGFDVVLHGHRHLSTFHAYADPRAERRWRACWLIGAPSATKKGWQGFNVVDAHGDGTFEVLAVRQSQGAWLEPQLVASRDYEETRSRRWRRETERPEPNCDVVEIDLAPYQHGTEAEKESQDLGGDLRVDVALHAPQNLGAVLSFPLTQVVSYHGASLRDVKADWIDSAGRSHRLRVKGDGLIDVSTVHQARSIHVGGVWLNALPSRAGDWHRMLASHGDTLLDPFTLRLAYPARFLRVRLHFPALEFLQPIARDTSLDAVSHESAYFSMHSDDDHGGCNQDVLVFRPVTKLLYCFTSGGTDPVLGSSASSTPLRAAKLQEGVARLGSATSIVRRNIQTALDRLRLDLIAAIRPNVRSGKNSRKYDDVSADLLSLGGYGETSGEIALVLTDSRTEARLESSNLQSHVGTRFPWGKGVVGRALRQGGWLAWTQQRHNRHSSVWPASDWYYPVPAVGLHAHIYCGPVYIVEDGAEIAVAMLSFATEETNSVLGDLIRKLRSEPSDSPLSSAIDQAVERFASELGGELAPAETETDERGGGADGQ